jgi:ribosomal protein L7/L12
MTEQLKTMTLEQLLEKIKGCETTAELTALRKIALAEVANVDEETQQKVMWLIHDCNKEKQTAEAHLNAKLFGEHYFKAIKHFNKNSR